MRENGILKKVVSEKRIGPKWAYLVI